VLSDDGLKCVATRYECEDDDIQYIKEQLLGETIEQEDKEMKFDNLMQDEIIEMIAEAIELLDREKLIKAHGIVEAHMMQREFDKS
jgi:hypothetical protein